MAIPVGHALGGKYSDRPPKYERVPKGSIVDLFAGWRTLIDRLGAVPRVLVSDSEGAIGRWRGGRSELTAECQAFRGTLGAKVIICKPADPEAKGIIERPMTRRTEWLCQTTSPPTLRRRSPSGSSTGRAPRTRAYPI
jgi:hypothetical protein